MHILIAPNAFKHGVSADEAAAAIAEGLGQSRFAGTWSSCPVGDGGDGTAELLARHDGGRVVECMVSDPLGRPIPSRFSLVDGGRTALIELADASGLRLLRRAELDPLRTTTFGTGELMRAALALGVSEIILCVGGSATVDGGTGILRALGVEFRDSNGVPLDALPEAMPEVTAIDVGRLDERLKACALTLVCDVTNPLLGEHGAARVFGPQKGASATDVLALEAALEKFSALVEDQTDMSIATLARGGAAGGVAAGLHALLDARLEAGTDYVLDRIGFDAALDGADIVITGEGAIDEQTPAGKAPWGVAQRSRRRGAFVVAFAGQVPVLASANLRAGFDVLLPIGNGVATLPQALQRTAENLTRTACEFGNTLALRSR